MGFHRLSAACVLAACLSACSGIIDPAKNTVETFSGTLAVATSIVITPFYTLSKSGEVEVTMTSVTPTPANGTLQFQLGQVVSGSCQLLQGYLAVAIVNRKVQYGVLNKLRRLLPRVDIDYAANTQLGLFEADEDHYGEVWYELGGRKVMSRVTTAEGVLEAIYDLAGVATPVESDVPFHGHPLAVPPKGAATGFYRLLPARLPPGSTSMLLIGTSRP